MATGSGRYLRYILFAVFGITIIYFISTSSLPSYAQPLTSGTAFSWERPEESKPSPVLNDIADTIHLPQTTSVAETSQSIETSTPNVVPTIPSELSPPAPGERVNATFVTLARNTDIWEIARSIRQVEDRFNRNYNYDWVFLNDKPFDDTFKKVTTSLVSGKTHYGEIPVEHWSFPPWIDQKKAEAVREDMRRRKIIYGDSVSYRHMCRFESGFFFRHPLLHQFEYYWRVEPSVELFCDVHYDPFRFMKENKKKYSFVLSLYEYVETIPTLWDSTKKFIKAHPEHISPDNSMGFLSDDGGDTYNKCHFWSNFEIGNLDWLRSKPYIDFFETLDKDGGFFYERWGDAPVHSIAAGLLLRKDEIHFFNDIAYYHVPFTHCPTGDDVRLKLRCHCNPADNFDWKGYSCTSRFFDLNKLKKPDGWEAQSEDAVVSLSWEILKYASLTFGVGSVLTIILMRIPWTRRKLLSWAERLAEWHESGLNRDEDENWYKRPEKPSNPANSG